MNPIANSTSMFLDKRALQQKMKALNEQLQVVPDPTVTPEHVRALMRADGVQPDENIFTCELLRMRYDEE